MEMASRLVFLFIFMIDSFSFFLPWKYMIGVGSAPFISHSPLSLTLFQPTRVFCGGGGFMFFCCFVLHYLFLVLFRTRRKETGSLFFKIRPYHADHVRYECFHFPTPSFVVFFSEARPLQKSYAPLCRPISTFPSHTPSSSWKQEQWAG